MAKEVIKKDIIDKKGESYTLEIESEGGFNVLENKNYKLQIPHHQIYKSARKKGIFTSEIGVKSSGFAPIFTLALIISIAGTILALLLWKF